MKTKKLLTRNFITAIVTLLFASPCVTLCSLAATEESDFHYLEYHYRDSAKISKGGYTVYDAKLEIPELGGIVTKAVYDSILTFITKTEDKTIFSIRNSSDMKKALDKIFSQKAKDYFDGHRETLKDDEDFDNGLPWFYDLEIGVREHCSDYITMYVTGYDYMGGAHGMPFEYGETFLTSNGHMMTWKDYAVNPEYLRPSISRNLDSEYLNNPDKIQPLPALDPWLRGDRLVFKYTAYEIAPYASGMPEAEIPYSDIQEYISPAVVSLCQKYVEENGPLGDGDDCDGEEGDFCMCDSEGNDVPLLYNQFSESVVVEGAPNIKSFVKAVFGNIANEGVMDMKNGYWSFSEEGSGRVDYNAAYWNRKDGSKLFVLSYCHTDFVQLPMKTSMASNPWMYYTLTPLEDDKNQGLAEETGYFTYLYDAATHKLNLVYDMSLLGDMENVYEHRYLILPQHGKDIKVREGASYKGQYRYRTLRWDGMKFNDGLKNKD